MKKSIIISALLILSTLLLSIKENDAEYFSTYLSLPTDDTLNAEVSKISAYKNLAIFFFTGKQTLDNVEFVTLSEALKKEYVTLFETGSVNQLAITNNSDHFIFIHAGDIVKGGRQDRTIGADIIVAPKIKDLPLASFCVEASRWTQRGDERADQFSVNENMLPSRNLKMAAKQDQNQSAVWSSVSAQQDKLNENVSKMKGEDIDVRSSVSATSLQLTLENKDLDSLCNVYRIQLESLPENKPVIGFAYAINGELYGGDIYNNSQLFLNMWPKLLHSVIVEAIADFESDTIEYALKENVCSELNKVYKGDTSTRNINDATRIFSFDTKIMVAHHTFDLAHGDWIHKSYIVKDTTQVVPRYEIDFNRNNINDNNNFQQNNLEQIYDAPNDPVNIQDVQQIQQNQQIQRQE
ncbi:MAG: hypothetical protein JXB49_25915 [Bacteroidales bacterium]|nr:hypothetical protein [Bacteroidales bacterium]